GAVLEMARGGVEIDAVVSFHGDLLSPTLEEDAAQTTAKVLVLHGAEDPYVPQGDVEQWIDVMLETEVDWTLVQYAGAVHSFTDPEANSPGQSAYHARTAKRAFALMHALFEEIWE
ncbi:MAG: dienelactone hydrolase family protein, partial [Opitutales bacterium]